MRERFLAYGNYRLGSTGVRTVDWDSESGCLRLIDQRLLPGELRVAVFCDYRQVVAAIQEMVVRGAPAIGVTAAFGMALAARQSEAQDVPALQRDLAVAGEALIGARPTAVNLRWAVNRIWRLCTQPGADTNELRRLALEEARRLADEDVAINRQMAMHGAGLIQADAAIAATP